MDTANAGLGGNYIWPFALTRMKSSLSNSPIIRLLTIKFIPNFSMPPQKRSSAHMLMEPMTERDVIEPTLPMGLLPLYHLREMPYIERVHPSIFGNGINRCKK
jgi:hypothetical protein